MAIHQAWRLPYVGIKKDPTTSGHTILLINHLMIDFETIIALTTMAYIVTLDTYEFHPKDEKTF